MKYLLAALSLAFSLTAQAQTSAPDLLTEAWPASWIAHPVASPYDYGVYHFRKRLDLDAVPEAFLVHASADNRYRLFVNGTPVGVGPARSGLRTWRYETYDLAPHLQAGSNVLAATVWNGGQHRPMEQVSHRTAFLLQGNTGRRRLPIRTPPGTCSRTRATARSSSRTTTRGWTTSTTWPAPSTASTRRATPGAGRTSATTTRRGRKPRRWTGPRRRGGRATRSGSSCRARSRF